MEEYKIMGKNGNFLKNGAMIKSPVNLSKKLKSRLHGCIQHYLHVNPREHICKIVLFRNVDRYHLRVFLDDHGYYSTSHTPFDQDDRHPKDASYDDDCQSNVILNNIFREVIEEHDYSMW